MPISKQKFKRLTTENVDKAPKRAGVYALYAGDALIFLGGTDTKKTTLRSRLRSHLGSDPREATRYKREAADEPTARLRELLKEYSSANGNKLPKYNATNGRS